MKERLRLHEPLLKVIANISNSIHYANPECAAANTNQVIGDPAIYPPKRSDGQIRSPSKNCRQRLRGRWL